MVAVPRPGAEQTCAQRCEPRPPSFVGVHGDSYGRVTADTGRSELEDEFELARDLPRLVYVRVPAP